MNIYQLLQEATRSQLIDKSKKADKTKTYGTTRYDRRTKSKLFNNIKNYNKIDMDALFKRDILTVNLDVQGETANYIVTVRFSGVLKEIQKAIKANNGIMEYKAIAQAMSRVFNTGDISINCNCADSQYRMRYYQNKNGYGTMYEPRPSNITNPNDTLGAGCKHTMLVISNLSWMIKIGGVLNNYIKYAQEHLQKLYADYIFPKLYGMKYDKAVQQELFFTGLLPNDQETIDAAMSQTLRNRDERGKFVKGNEYRFTKEDTNKVIPDKNQKEFKFSNDKKELELPDTQRQMTIDDYDNEGQKVVGNGQLIKDKRKYNRKNPLVGKKIEPISKDQISMFDDEEDEE